MRSIALSSILKDSYKTYSETRISVGTLKLDGPALLAAVVCVPLSVYGDWIPALVCGISLLLADRFQSTWKSQAKIASTRSFTVCAPTPEDADALTSIYERDYLQAHSQMHKKVAGHASIKEWEEALGSVNFSDLLQSGEITNKGDVRLLKLVENDGAGGVSSPIGYVLYEMREKGQQGKKRQRWCELVNIVVHSDHRGCGAGRMLFDGLTANLAATGSSRNEDLRLYVAEHNAAPKAWYQRMGFVDAGWQTENLRGAEVRFVRMMLKKQQ